MGKVHTIVSDFSRVLLFPTDESYDGGLNALNKELARVGSDLNFSSYFSLNEELLNFYADLNTSTPIYIFTSDSVQDQPEIKDTVNAAVSGVFSAKKLGLDKQDSEAYRTLAAILKCKPAEMLYIDDQPVNIQAAKKAGFQTVLYENNSQVIQLICAAVQA